jgi:hypothetical protein
MKQAIYDSLGRAVAILPRGADAERTLRRQWGPGWRADAVPADVTLASLNEGRGALTIPPPRPHPGRPPRHIAWLAPCFMRGGLETVTLAHLRHLAGRYRLTLIAGHVDERRVAELPAGVELIVAPECYEWEIERLDRTPTVAEAARRLIARLAPDMVVGSLSHGAMFGARAAGVPYIVEYWHGIGGWHEMAHPADLAIGVSEDARATVSARRVGAPPSITIPNGVELSRFLVPEVFEGRGGGGEEDAAGGDAEAPLTLALSPFWGERGQVLGGERGRFLGGRGDRFVGGRAATRAR